jgi:uncharacterized membrane protein YidH (DUF202 family)
VPTGRPAPLPPSDDADRGLAGERTQLAWNRSGLAVVAVLVVLVRRLWPLGDVAAIAILAVVAAGSLAWAAGMFLARTGGDGAGTTRVMGARACRMVTVGTLTLAGAGVLLAFVAPP